MSSNLARHFLLRDDVTFLNHGSFGACPRVVFEDYQRWQLTLERQPVAFLDSRRNLASNLRVMREALATEFGTAPDNIAAVSNATAGLNIIAQSLPLQPDDEILTTDHEYSALEKTWAYVARKTGARIVEVEVPLPLVSAEAFEHAILSAITPPVALAVYAAAGLAKANLWQAGWTAVRVGAAGFIVPFMFVFEPSLLMIGDWKVILHSFTTAAIGTICLAAGLFGYLFREARVWERVFLVGAAVLLIKPGLITDLIGLGLIVAVGTSQLASRGAKPVANSRAVE